MLHHNNITNNSKHVCIIPHSNSEFNLDIILEPIEMLQHAVYPLVTVMKAYELCPIRTARSSFLCITCCGHGGYGMQSRKLDFQIYDDSYNGVT